MMPTHAPGAWGFGSGSRSRAGPASLYGLVLPPADFRQPPEAA